MVEHDESERAYMKEMRVLATDPFGREHLVGLNEEESDFYIRCSRNRSNTSEDRDRYLTLYEKHERARQ